VAASLLLTVHDSKFQSILLPLLELTFPYSLPSVYCMGMSTNEEIRRCLKHVKYEVRSKMVEATKSQDGALSISQW